MIRITIVCYKENDRTIISSCLSEQKDFFIISAGEDGFHALRSTLNHKPDIIIMDYYLKDINSHDLAPIIKRNSPSTSLIALCSDNECKMVNKALDAGISGCILRQECYDHLVSTVRSVFYGGVYLSEPFRKNGFSEIIIKTNNNFLQYGFSKTELLVFFSITLGKSDGEIAKDLNISKNSVRNLIFNAKRKTGFKNRTQISLYVMLSGLLNTAKIIEQFMKPENETPVNKETRVNEIKNNICYLPKTLTKVPYR